MLINHTTMEKRREGDEKIFYSFMKEMKRKNERNEEEEEHNARHKYEEMSQHPRDNLQLYYVFLIFSITKDI